MSTSRENLKPILKKHGQVMLEELQDLTLCKPRLIPLKSFTLEKLEKMQNAAQSSQEKPAENNE